MKLRLLAAILIIVVVAIAAQTWPQKVDTTKTPKGSNPVKTPTGSIKKNREQKFEIKILSVEETGTLSRKITARLTNKDGYAKNVRVYVQLLLDGDVIRINGKDKLEIDVGDMKPNESVDKTAEISVGFFDGLKIKSKGYVDVKLVISWDKGREVIRKRIMI